VNYLELCNALHEKTGESGADLTAVTGQSGYYLKVVNGIRDAWIRIQTKHTTWRFLRHEALPTIAASNNTIDADAWTVSNLSLSIDEYHKKSFSIYLTATGISDESKLTYVPWEQWKRNFGILYDDGTENRPSHITIDPDTDDLIVGPTTDDAYTVSFDFNAIPVTLAADGDTPNVVSSLHEIIVWEALARYGSREESKEDRAEGKMMAKRMMRRLEKRELPAVTLPDPLA